MRLSLLPKSGCEYGSGISRLHDLETSLYVETVLGIEEIKT